MPRVKVYTDQDVLTAARERIRHVYDIFDSVAVSFSGGKDSLVCLHLVKEEAERRGRLPVPVIFRDEELIPDAVVNFVNRYRLEPWIKMRWLCYPLINNKYILGKHHDYWQWDPNREWVRQPPPWAERPPAGSRGYGQHDMDDVAAEGLPGKVGLVLGIRASESLTRFRSVVNKLNENYICKPANSMSKRVMLVKPIYDWEESDVMKFLAEEGIGWCSLYDAQHVSQSGLRVSTPLHVENAKRFGKWREWAPELYEAMMRVFPEMQAQERYYADFDKHALTRKFAGKGFDGVEEYIRETITDKVARRRAMARLEEFRVLSKRSPEAYSPEYLLKVLSTGSIERVILPQGKRARKKANA